jgi:hypothetical protein
MSQFGNIFAKSDARYQGQCYRERIPRRPELSNRKLSDGVVAACLKIQVIAVKVVDLQQAVH